MRSCPSFLPGREWIFNALHRVAASKWIKARKAAGVKLHRPKGKSKVDPYREEIVALLKNGSTQAYVAKRYGTTAPNLNNWLKQRGIDPRPVFPEDEKTGRVNSSE